MALQNSPSIVAWRLHLASPPALVFEFLATDAGRAHFWAESAIEQDSDADVIFPVAALLQGAVLEQEPPRRVSVRHPGGSATTLDLLDDGSGGTDLRLTDVGAPGEDRTEVIASWVSLLLALQAALDFSVDLRGHDQGGVWASSYEEH